jgi:hypothetical protein
MILFSAWTGSYDNYMRLLLAILGPVEDKTFIDLCAAEATISRNLPFRHKTYVDINPRWVIPAAAEHGLAARYVTADVLGAHAVFDEHYDVAFCSDGIEHFRKADGRRLLRRMQQLADRQVIFTPLGVYETDENAIGPDTHKSAWVPADLPGFAFIVLPHYHPFVGAFFAWHCPGVRQELERLKHDHRDWWVRSIRIGYG